MKQKIKFPLFPNSWFNVDYTMINTTIMLHIRAVAFPITPCSLGNGYKPFGRDYCLHPQGIKRKLKAYSY